MFHLFWIYSQYFRSFCFLYKRLWWSGTINPRLNWRLVVTYLEIFSFVDNAIKTSIEQWTNWKKSGSRHVLHRLKEVFVNQCCSACCNSTTPPAGSVCSCVWKTQRWRWVNRSRSKGQFLLLGISVNIFNPFVFWAVWTGTIVGGGGYWCQMGVTCCGCLDPDMF